jgi:two-component system LytT family response regulator
MVPHALNSFIMKQQTKSLSVMIVDGDPKSAKTLSNIIDSRNSELEILGIFNEPTRAMKVLRERIPDIVFIDMETPEMNGLDMIKLLPPGLERNVIYITNHEVFAVKALGLGIQDYMLKPISEPIVHATVDNFIARKHQEQFRLRQKLSDKLLINKHDRAIIIDVNDIVYIEAEGPYANFALVDNTHIKSSKAIGYYLNLLSDKGSLMRVNRSYAINFDHIKEIVKDENGDGKLVLKNEHQIEFSSKMKNRLIQNIQEIINGSIRG